MYRLARSLTCRHRALVQYFGQELDVPDTGCGACDHCLGENEVLEDSVTVARKILSCVARVRERFGARYVAEVLKGARHARIVENGHDQLSTHGLLSDHPVETIGHWIDQLIGCGFLARGDGEYPTVAITETGQRLMRQAEGAIALSRPVRKDKAKRTRDDHSREADELGPFSEDLFQLLRGVRRNLATARGVPPYVIFSDASLVDMARRLPTSPEAFRRVKGVGEQKATSLAGHFLPVIQTWLATTASPTPVPVCVQAPPPATTHASQEPPAEACVQAPPPATTHASQEPPAEACVQAPPPATTHASQEPPAEACVQAPPPATTHASQEPPAEACVQAPPAEDAPRRKGKQESFALLATGASIESVAKETFRAVSTVENDLAEFLLAHPEVDATPWMEADTLPRVLPLLEASEDGRLKPVFEALGGEISYGQIRLAKVVLERKLLPQALGT